MIVVKHAGERQTFSVREVAHNHVEWVAGQGHYDLGYAEGCPLHGREGGGPDMTTYDAPHPLNRATMRARACNSVALISVTAQSWCPGKYSRATQSHLPLVSRFVVTLLDDVSPGTSRLLNILIDAHAQYDQWPHRQYIAGELAKEDLDLPDVLNDLPEWRHGYRAIQVLTDPAPLPNVPRELGDRLAPTVYGLVHSGKGDHIVSLFLASVKAACDQQAGFLPDPMKVKPVVLTSDALMRRVSQITSRNLFGEHAALVRLMLAGEPVTWNRVSSDPGDPQWEWNLSFQPLRPFAVDTGMDYLAALEQLIGHRPEPAPYGAPVQPSALPRALDHLDLVWRVRTGEPLFKRPGFARTASLAEGASSGDEFDARCNALTDVFSGLTVPRVDNTEGALNFLKADLNERITDLDSLERAREAVGELQQVVKLRRGQAHASAAKDSLQAAARLGIRYTGDWAESWNRVRQVTIDAVYTLIDELEPT